MLTTRRARSNGPAFLLGWLVGLGVVGAVVLLLADPAGASEGAQPATWVSWLKLVLGVLLLLVAVLCLVIGMKLIGDALGGLTP